MKKKSLNKVYSVIILGVLAAGNILFVDSEVWNASAGTELDITAWNVADYKVDGVSMLKDGGYLVKSSEEGYQSTIQVAVTFDAAGEVIQSVEVLSQAETDGIGSKVTDEAFLGRLGGVTAPLGLKDKDMTVSSPGTGEVWGAQGAAAAEPEPAAEAADNRSNPARWNPEDQSPEAIAARKLYGAGLLTTATQKQPMKTAIADESPEVQAAYRLEESGLTDSAAVGASPSRDQSPEGVAAGELQKAGLTTTADGSASPAREQSPEAVAAGKLEAAGLTVVEVEAPAETPAAVSSGNLTEVDAVSGATVSSTAVVRAIDNAWFFMQEQVLNGN